MTQNEKLYQKALQAINDLFCDQSVSQAKAKENLSGLKDEIEALVDTLE